MSLAAHNRLLLAMTAGFAGLSAAAIPAHAQCTPSAPCASLLNLGLLPGGVFFSGGLGISADGSAVVGFGDSGVFSQSAFRWTAPTGMVQIQSGDFAAGLASVALGANSDGSVVVGYGDIGGFQRAFRWTNATGMLNIQSGDFAAGIYSVVYGVNADGSVVVGYGDIGGNGRAFRWTDATGMVNIQSGAFASSSFSLAYGVNADGSVIVGYGEIGGNFSAFRWTASTGMINIHGGDFAAGSTSTAYGVNSDGSVVVGSGEIGGGGRAFRWTAPTGMVNIQSGDFAAGSFSVAYGVNADGSVVVGQGDNGGQRAFRWTAPTGMRDLNLLLANAGVNMTGILLYNAQGVSADGQFIVGTGAFSGSSRAYLLRYDDSSGTPIAGVTNPDALVQSFNALLATRAAVLIQQQGFAAPLLGANTPMGLGNEVGVFASAGSASAGGHARYAFGNGFTVLGGIAYAKEDYSNADLKNSVTGAGAVRYVFDGAWWRPFLESGGWYTPNADLTFYRNYANGAGIATGVGNTRGDLSYFYGRAGLLLAKTQQSQLVISGEIGRQELKTSAYLEADSAQNPFYALVSGGSDRMTVTKLRASASHAFNAQFDATLWGAWSYGFDRKSDVTATMFGVGKLSPAALNNLNWFEYGARVGYRMTRNMTLDVFANGVTGEGVIDTKIHLGGALRAVF